MTLRYVKQGQHRLALNTRHGRQDDYRPGILFCGGFNSNMEGSKALSLDRFCQRHDLAFTRFDYSGHGSSEGAFSDGNIGTWLADTLCVIDQLDPQRKYIVVGSSMGGWIATLAALERAVRICGLITIAAAPDFTERLLLQRLDDYQRVQLATGTTIMMPTEYDDGAPYPITPQLIEHSKKHCVLGSSINIDIPVRLLHGTSDTDVPFQCSIDLMQALDTPDATLTLIKKGDHRLSSPLHLQLLDRTVLKMVETLSG